MKKRNKLWHGTITATGLAALIFGTIGILYSLENIVPTPTGPIPYSQRKSSSQWATPTLWATPGLDISPTPQTYSTATPGHSPPLISDSTPTPAANSDGSASPSSIDDKLTPTPAAQNENGRGKATGSIDDIVSTPTPSSESEEDGSSILSSTDVTKRVTLAPARAVQAGFLSPSVSIYSASGFGGVVVKGKTNSPESYHLIIFDKEGKAVYIEPKILQPGEAGFVWNNRNLKPGTYTAKVVSGPWPIIKSDTANGIVIDYFRLSNSTEIFSQEFDVVPFDLSKNNMQLNSSGGYSMALEGNKAVIKPSDYSSSYLVELNVYDAQGRMIEVYDAGGMPIPQIRRQLSFGNYEFVRPSQGFRVEAAITKITSQRNTPTMAETNLLAASYLPAMQKPINSPIVR